MSIDLPFIITKDVINNQSSISNEEIETSQVTPALKKQYPVRFRLLDCDEIVYSYGRMTKEADEFLPLDELGAGYGCMDIQVYENSKWVTV